MATGMTAHSFSKTPAGGLRIAILALSASFLASAERIELSPAETSPYADTEVSTNIPFSVDVEQTRELALSFALDGCTSNCIQVAFGRDSDGDGALGFDETSTLYGWRNGRYFAESVSDAVRTEEADGGGATSRVFFVSLQLKSGGGLKCLAATNDVGVAVFTNLNAAAHAWLFSPDWNMMRVTRRGPGVPAEWFACEIKSHYLYIRLR